MQRESDRKTRELLEVVIATYTESEVQQTWCACVYSANKKEILYIGRILKRFLKDVDGPCTKVEINCCMKEQSGTFGVYENVPSHLLKDIDIFETKNVIPQAVMIPIKGGKWKLENSKEIRNIFAIKTFDRMVEIDNFISSF